MENFEGRSQIKSWTSPITARLSRQFTAMKKQILDMQMV